jgi:hypothetical protein
MGVGVTSVGQHREVHTGYWSTTDWTVAEQEKGERKIAGRSRPTYRSVPGDYSQSMHQRSPTCTL